MDDGEEFREGIRISEAIGRVDKSLNNGEKDKVPTNVSSSKEISGKTALANLPTMIDIKFHSGFYM